MPHACLLACLFAGWLTEDMPCEVHSAERSVADRRHDVKVVQPVAFRLRRSEQARRVEQGRALQVLREGDTGKPQTRSRAPLQAWAASL